MSQEMFCTPPLSKLDTRPSANATHQASSRLSAENKMRNERSRLQAIERRKARMNRERASKARRAAHINAPHTLLSLITECAIPAIDREVYDFCTQYFGIPTLLRAQYTTICPTYKLINVWPRYRIPLLFCTVAYLSFLLYFEFSFHFRDFQQGFSKIFLLCIYC